MNKFVSIVAASVAALTVAAAHADSVVFDQGPATGTQDGLWQNQTALQNFADHVTLAQTTQITGYNYFTTFDLSSDSGSSDFFLKVYSDNAGAPGTLLVGENVGYSSIATVDGFNEYHFDFSPLTFLAGQTYWIGMSGNGFEAAQPGVTIAGTDNQMAQFDGSTYEYMTNVGNQMFQLTSAVPETDSALLLLAGLATIGSIARRRAQRR